MASPAESRGGVTKPFEAGRRRLRLQKVRLIVLGWIGRDVAGSRLVVATIRPRCFFCHFAEKLPGFSGNIDVPIKPLSIFV